jgi:hypothetical protein
MGLAALCCASGRLLMTTINDMLTEFEDQPFVEESPGGYKLTFAGTAYCLHLLRSGGFISMNHLPTPPSRDTDVDEYLNEADFQSLHVDIREAVAKYAAIAKKISEEQPEKYKQVEQDVFLMALFKATLDQKKPH